MAIVLRPALSARSIATLGIPAALALLLAAGPAGAQPGATTLDEPGDRLVVGVLTMGQGDLVYELFGHNALWIHDPVAGTSRVYNYGVFDFDSPGYWGRFIRGTWLYQLVVHDFSHTLATYQFLNRSVWLQVLNLTGAQKRALRDFLEWNARPENRDYRYDYYRDNCSTRVRDALDRVLGGALAAATQGVGTGTTYRWHSERLIASDRLSYTGILIALGPRVDLEIDAWEEMFIPFKVQDQLRRLTVVDDEGRTVPLVAREETLFLAIDRAGERATPPFRLPWFAIAGIAGGGLLAWLGGASRTSRGARTLLATTTVVWGLLAGVIGLIVAGLWAFTDHDFVYQNLNLLQVNPLALGLVVLMPALVARVGAAVRPARVLTWLLAGASLLGLAVLPNPWLVQHNLPVVLLVVPIHLGLAVAVSRLTASMAHGTPRPART